MFIVKTIRHCPCCGQKKVETRLPKRDKAQEARLMKIALDLLEKKIEFEF